MKLLSRHLLSAALVLPALFFCGAGILYLAFKLESANRMLEILLASYWTRWLLSPVLVLGGPLLTLWIHARKICSLRAYVHDHELTVAMSIRGMAAHLVFAMIAVSLLILLLTYAFVENFTIVAR